MTSRERVTAAYSLQEPDRVPVCIGGTAQKFSNRIYFEVKEVLGIEDKLDREREVDELGSVIYYHPKVLDHFNCDFRHVQINRLPAKKKFDDGSWEHELGFVLKPNCDNGLISIVSAPLAHASKSDISSFDWPNPYSPKRTEGVKNDAVDYRENTDFAVGMYKATLLGVFDLCCALRGMDTFLMDLMLHEELAQALLERVFAFTYTVYEQLLEEAGEYVDVVEFNDDLGTQENLLLPPDIYRKFVKPYHAQIVELIKKKAPNAKVFLHSCGSVYDIINDFIEIGVDILNPIQPYANKMKSDNLKKEFGDKLCFQGGIDLQRAMIGSTDDVKIEIRERITTLGRHGGYVLATANNISGDIPVENVLTLYEETHAMGKYPL
jgi:uroporphyrinogen decarboxylase